jgi:hypothetical protein
MGLDTILAVSALVIAVLSAIGTVRATYQVARSGFRASESVLSDLATLLAALRSIATKGAIVMGEGRTTPIPIETELDTVRSFVTSTSGLALSLHAGEVGSEGASEDTRAGAWRILRFHLTNLAAMQIASTSDNQVAARLALDIERTVGTLDEQAIKRVRQQIKNLPRVLTSLEDSRKQDILLAALDHVVSAQPQADNHQKAYGRLRALKESGVRDPDVDMFLAVEGGDDRIAELQDALDRGADVNVALNEVLSRYKDVETGKQ